ncbi:MAG: hypothetical protein IKL80_03130, partial [Clostridia bacterium]|nr:hypothetical protein [Clostridia bacterium]
NNDNNNNDNNNNDNNNNDNTNNDNNNNDNTNNDNTNNDNTNNDNNNNDNNNNDNNNNDNNNNDDDNDDNTGDDNNNNDDNQGEEEEDPVDYEAVNAAMVEKLNDVIDALDMNNPDGYYGLFSKGQRTNIIDPIVAALKDAVEQSASNVIDEDFIRETYEGSIEDIHDYYLDMSDADLFDFQEAIGIVNEATYGAILWIAAQFGLL